jgi:DNA polymerase III alpha subunit
VKSVAQEEAQWIVAARANGYPDVETVWRRAGVMPRTLQKLAEADVFASLGLARREALWAARALGGAAPLPLFAAGFEGETSVEPAVTLPPMSLGEEVVEDYVALRLSLRAHPLALLRHLLTPGMGAGASPGGNGAGGPGGARRAAPPGGMHGTG